MNNFRQQLLSPWGNHKAIGGHLPIALYLKLNVSYTAFIDSKVAFEMEIHRMKLQKKTFQLQFDCAQKLLLCLETGKFPIY